MSVLSEIFKFEDENKKIKILKPLWNVITDYLVVFLAVMSIVFGGMQITSGNFQCLAAVDCPECYASPFPNFVSTQTRVDQQPDSTNSETARLVPDNNQPHEFDNISQNSSRRHADDQPRDTDAAEMLASNNDGNQPYNFNILQDPATISAVKTLYEKQKEIIL
ncbi:Hypothetical predicted protein [Paramuricea clavata]|uniref:LRRC8 pannexin-like TM region domain-containing protein n=1 Tax=Paramuricea clavata TaxID=317549 RepID=A0A6S7GDS9_PARCT|nr:Hypothetical predicted protein [Paramuricea clavata]